MANIPPSEFDRIGLDTHRFRPFGNSEWHGPCPFCGGTDRFSVQPHAAEPRWLCRNCTEAKWQDVIAFVMRRDDCDFMTACQTLGGDIQISAERREHLHAHESYFASYGGSFIFRGPIRSADGADNTGTALLLELPDRAAADKFWAEEPFSKNGGYARDARIVRWVFGD